MKIDKLSLLSRGWTVQEIERASRVLEEAERKSRIGPRFVDTGIHGTLFFVLLIISIVATVSSVPVIFAMEQLFAYIAIAFIGLVFGTVFAVLLSNIDHPNSHKAFIAGFLFSGLINTGAIVVFAHEVSIKTGLTPVIIPAISGILYFFCFLIPYLVSRLKQ